MIDTDTMRDMQLTVGVTEIDILTMCDEIDNLRADNKRLKDVALEFADEQLKASEEFFDGLNAEIEEAKQEFIASITPIMQENAELKLELARVKREMDATYNLLAYMFGCPLNYTTIRHGSVAEYIASPVPENTSDETSWKMFVAAIMRDDNTKEDER